MNKAQTLQNIEQLDKLLTLPEAAAWLGIELRALLDNVRRKRVPVIKINQRLFRFHLPTVLAALQKGGIRG